MRIFVYILVVTLLSSCYTNRLVTEIHEDINNQKKLYAALILKIDSTDEKRVAKLKTGEIDPTTDSLTAKYLRQLKDSIAFRLGYFNALANKKIRKDRKNVVAYFNQVKNSYPSELENVYLLDDLFAISTFNRLNTAAFFGPGQYQLSDSTGSYAAEVMQSISKEALDFSAKHTAIKLNAMFIVLGYADEQDITNGTVLYNELIKSFPDSSATRMQLNTELSNRRAHTIKTILKGQYDSLALKLANSSLATSFVATGKGEQLPAGNKTYQPIDDSRRVVLVYWNILPDLKIE